MIQSSRTTNETHVVEIPSDLYRQLAEEGAASGLTVDALVVQAVRYVIDDVMGSGSRPSVGETTAELGVERTVDEVNRLFEGEWILMRVTGLNEHHSPEKGIVLDHSFRRGDISDTLAKQPSREELRAAGLDQPFYIFRAFPSIGPGPETDRALLEMVAGLRAMGFAATTSPPTPTQAAALGTSRASQ